MGARRICRRVSSNAPCSSLQTLNLRRYRSPSPLFPHQHHSFFFLSILFFFSEQRRSRAATAESEPARRLALLVARPFGAGALSFSYSNSETAFQNDTSFAFASCVRPFFFPLLATPSVPYCDRQTRCRRRRLARKPVQVDRQIKVDKTARGPRQTLDVSACNCTSRVQLVRSPSHFLVKQTFA